MVMVRLLLVVSIIFGLGIESILAQNISNVSGPCPIEVSDFQVSIIDVMKLKPTSGTMGMSGNMGMSSTAPMAAQVGEGKLIFSLKSKVPDNGKMTAVIYWESRFFNAKQEMVVKEFKSKKKIKPGKDESIEESIYYDAKLVPSSAKFGFRITKIEFSDNSVWESKNSDADSQLVYKTINFK
jgi:hypothetical protein